MHFGGRLGSDQDYYSSDQRYTANGPLKYLVLMVLR